MMKRYIHHLKKIILKNIFCFRTPAIVEEDDGDEIFITYKEGNGANEWINKDSHRIKPMNYWIGSSTKVQR